MLVVLFSILGLKHPVLLKDALDEQRGHIVPLLNLTQGGKIMLMIADLILLMMHEADLI